jgi:hypothetical protein
MLKLKEKEWSEKRAGRRLPVHLLSYAGIAVEGRHSWIRPRHPEFNGTLVDAAMFGCQILSERHIPVDSIIRLWVQVKRDGVVEPLKLRGDVIRCVNAEIAGQHLLGIKLRPRPEKNMAVWSSAIIEGIRGVEEL